MNKNRYRIIFSHARGMFIAVAEIVKSKTKQAGQSQGTMETGSITSSVSPIHYKKLNPLNFAVIGCLGALVISLPMSSVAGTQIIADKGAPTSQQPTILNSANGTTQVNIQTPSAGGVSRNTYTQFDVGQEGAILNNSRNNTQTQIGGWVQGNPWLATGEAKVILNEVNSSNPSQLKGYIEVAGKQAQVVIANPSGLICDGCGVINADRFTLTTGQAVMNQGYLESFRVREGQVTIEGKGLNGSLTPYTDIYARALKVNAGLYANELGTVLGQNDIQVKDQVTPQIKATTGSTSTPQPNFALDVGQLGGMYAGKIFLVGTEQGLGVRNAGSINSTQSSLTLNTNGDLVNSGNLIANKDQVQLKAQNIQNTGNISSATSQISVESQNLNNSGLISSADELHLQNQNTITNSGTLNAARIAINSKNLKNSGSIEQTGIQGLDLKSGSMTNLGGKIGIAKSNTGGGTGGSTGGSVPTVPTDPSKDGGSLGVVTPVDTTPKTYDTGFIHVSGVLNNDQGAIVANGGVDLDSQNGLDNQGGQLNLGAINIKGSNFNNNQGQFTVKSADIQTSSFTNQQGQLASNSTLNIQTQSANNKGGKIQSIGQLDLAVTGELNNVDGQIASGATVNVTASDLKNQSGVVYSENQAVNIKANKAIDNTEGLIQAKTNLNLNSQSLNNTAGQIVANQINQKHVMVNNNQGSIAAQQNLNSTAQQFDNTQGQIQAKSIKLQHDQLKNTGSVYADQDLTITGQNTQNAGTLAAGKNVQITSSTLEHSVGGLIAAGLDREGKLANAGDVSIRSDQVGLHGQTLAGGNLKVQAQSNIDAAKGQLQAQNIELDSVTGNISTQAGSVVAQNQLKLTSQNLINNQQGLLSSQDLILTAKQLDNSQGKIQHTGTNDLNLQFANGLNNKAGEISSNASSINLNTSALNNEAGKIIHAGNQQLNITADQLQGAQGYILSNGQLVLKGGQVVLDGATTSANQINISANSLSHQKGQMIQRGTLKPLTLAVKEQINNQSGLIQSPTALYITSDSLNNQGGQLSSAQGQNLNLQIQGLLDNSQAGKIYAGQDSIIQAGAVDNLDGLISAQNALTVTSLGVINNRSGKIIANSDVGIQSEGLDNTSGQIGSVQGGLTLDAGTGKLTNQSGSLQSAQDIQIKANQLSNQSGLINTQGAIQAQITQDIDNSAGQIVANKAVLLSSQGLNNNAGLIGSVEDIVNIDAGSGVLSNQQGHIQSVKDLTLKAQGIDNQQGVIATQAKLDMQQQWLNNTKGQIISGTTLNFVGEDFNNQGGLLQSGADLNFKLSGLLDNSQSGQLASGGNTDIQAGSVKNSGQGKISTQGVLNIDAVQAIDNQSGTMVANQDITLTSQGLNNTQGQIGSKNGSLTIDAGQGQLSNQAGSLQAGTELRLQAAGINNDSGIVGSLGNSHILSSGDISNNAGQIATNATLQVSGQNLTNQAGTIQSGNGSALDLVINGALDNSQAGQLLSGAGLNLQVNALDNSQQGQISAQDALNIMSAGLINNQAGTIVANQDVTLNSQGLNNNQGQIGSIQGGLTVDTGNQALSNKAGTLQAKTDLTAKALSIDSTEGQIISQAKIDLQSQKEVNNQQGTISADQGVQVKAQGLNNNLGQIGSQGDIVLNAGQGLLSNQTGKIIAGRALQLNADQVDNSQQGQLNSQTTLDIQTTKDINNQSGVIAANQKVNLNSQGLNNNKGQIVSLNDALTVNSGTGALDNQSGVLQAKGNIQIDAEQVNSQSGLISSEDRIDLQAHQLVDNSSGQIIANHAIQIQSLGLNNNQGQIASVNDVLNIDSGSGELQNQAGLLQAQGDIQLTADRLLNQSGLINTQGNLTAQIDQDIDNSAGQIVANQAVQLNSQGLNNNAGQIGSVAGDVLLDAGSGDLSNQSGKIISTQDLTLNAQHVDNQSGLISAQQLILNTQGLNNRQGQIISGTALTFVGQDLNNQGGLLQTDSDLNLNLSGVLDNSLGGQLYSGGSTTVQAASLNNSSQGQISTQGDLNLTTAQGINNAGGIIVSSQQMQLKSQGLNNDGGQIGTEQGDLQIETGGLALNNGTGTIQSGKTLSLDVNGLTNSGVISALHQLTVSSQGDVNNDHGQILSNKQLQLAGQNLSNQTGIIQSGEQSNLDLDIKGVLNNQAGQIHGGANTQIDANSINNSQQGQISAQDALNIISVGLVDNQAGTLVANQDVTLNSQGLNNNQGQIGSVEGGLTVDTGNQALSNKAGTLQAKTDIAVKALSVDNSAGQINAQGGIDLVSQQNINNTQGSIVGDQRLNIKAQGLNNNQGQIGTQGDLNLSIGSGSLQNQTGLLQAGQNLTVDAAAIDNSSTGKINAQGNVTLQSTGLINNTAGVIAANQDVTLTSQGLNNTKGQIGSVAGSLNLDSGDQILNNQSGSLLSNNQISIHATGLNNSQGQIVAQQLLDIDAELQALNNQQGLMSSDTVNIISGAFNNDQGLIQAKTSLVLDTNGQNLVNTNSGTQGGLLSQGNLTLKNLGTLDNSKGYVASGQNLSLSAHQVENGGGTLLATQNLKLQGTGQNQLLNNQSGQILSLGDMQLSIEHINNQGKLTSTDADSHIMAAGQLDIQTQQLDNQNTKALTDTDTSVQGIDAGNLNLEASIVNNQSGTIRSSENSQLNISQQLNNQAGEISAVKQLGIQGDQLVMNNLNGQLLAGENLNVNVKSLSGDGRVLSLGDANIILKDNFKQTQPGQLQANNNLSLSTVGDIQNDGTINAGNTLKLNASNINNSSNAKIESHDTQVTAQNQINNTGLINGDLTTLTADTLNNQGTGRIYGTDLAISANTLNNLPDVNGAAPVIASRGDMNLGVQTLNNLANATDYASQALIFSAGNLYLGGALDTNRKATGKATVINNESATIESLGDMHLSATQINNINKHFITDDNVEVSRVDGLEKFCNAWCTFDGQYTDGNWYEDWMRYTYSEITYETRTVESAPGQIKAGGNLDLSGAQVLNDKSQILAGGELKNVGGTIDSGNSLDGIRKVVDKGTVYKHWEYEGDWEGPFEVSTESTFDLQISQALGNQNFSQNPISITAVANNQSGEQVQAGQIQAGHLNDLKDSDASTQVGPVENAQGQQLNVADTGVTSHQVSVQGGQQNLSTQEMKELNVDVDGSGLNVSQAGQASGQNLASIQPDTLQSDVQVGDVNQNTNIIDAKDNTTQVSVLDQLQGQTASQVSGATTTDQTTAPDQAGTGEQFEIRTVNTNNVKVANNALYRTGTDSQAGYFVETDPSFTNYNQWLSSDYMLNALGLDPALQQKRLGDGFYEQRMVQDQIAHLTGYRFLEGYSSDDEQYKALMNNGVTFAKQYGLRPGIALSAAQIAQLTSDIVWLVEKDVTLQDGTKTKALVPQVYVKARVGDLKGDGTLLTGNSVNFKLNGDLLNGSTIAGREAVQITADNINNLKGRIQGNTVDITAQKDLNNIGGQISAKDAMALKVGGNLNIETTIRTSTSQVGDFSASTTGVDRIAGLYVGQGNTVQPTKASLLVDVAGNTVLKAAELNNSNGATVINTVGNVDIGTVQTGYKLSTYRDVQNQTTSQKTQDVGSQIASAGSLIVQGQNISGKAIQLSSQAGNIELLAQKDIQLDNGLKQSSVDTKASWKGSFGGKKSSTYNAHEVVSQANQLNAGQNIIINSQQGNISATHVLANAGNNIQIHAEQGDVNLLSAIDEKSSSATSSKKNAATYNNRQSGYIDQEVAQTTLKAGNTVDINAGKNIELQANDVQAGQSIYVGNTLMQRQADGTLKAADGSVMPENVILSTLETHDQQWDEQQKGYRGIAKELVKSLAIGMPGLEAAAPGLNLQKKLTVGESSSQRTEQIRQAGTNLNAANIAVGSSGQTTLTSADLTAKNVALSGQKVTLNAAEEQNIESRSHSNETIEGLGAKLNKDSIRLGGFVSEKDKQNVTITETTHKAGSIKTDNLSINGAEGVDILGQNIKATGDTTIDHGRGTLNVSGYENKTTTEETTKNETISTEVGVRNAYLDAALAVVAVKDAASALKDAKDAYSQAQRDYAAGKLTKEALDDSKANVAMATANLASAQIAVGASAAAAAASSATYGFTIGANGERIETTTNSNQTQGHWQGSHLELNNLTLKSEGQNANIQGSRLTATGTTTFNGTKDLNVTAGTEHSTQESSSKTNSQSVSYTYGGGGSASIGKQTSQSQSESLTHVNSEVALNRTEGQLNKLNIQGGEVSIADRGNLQVNQIHVESLQDTAKSSNSSKGGSIGAGFGSSGISNVSASYNQSKGSSDSAWVNNTSKLLVGDKDHDANLDAMGVKQVTNIGGVIANATKNADGTLTDHKGLNYSGALELKDIQDHNYNSSRGLNVSTTIGKTTQEKDGQKSKYPNGSTTLGLQSNGQETEQLSKATMGQGTVKNTTELTNRDINTTQEITRDQTTGMLNGSVTVDHRLLSESGRAEIVQQQKDLPENFRQSAENLVQALPDNAYKQRALKSLNNIQAGLANNPEMLAKGGNEVYEGYKEFIRQGGEPEQYEALLNKEVLPLAKELNNTAKQTLDEIQKQIAEEYQVSDDTARSIVREVLTAVSQQNEANTNTTDETGTPDPNKPYKGTFELPKIVVTAKGDAVLIQGSQSDEASIAGENVVKVIDGSNLAIKLFDQSAAVSYKVNDAIEKTGIDPATAGLALSLAFGGPIGLAKDLIVDTVAGDQIAQGSDALKNEVTAVVRDTSYDTVSGYTSNSTKQQLSGLNDPASQTALQVSEQLQRTKDGVGFLASVVLGAGGIAKTTKIDGKDVEVSTAGVGSNSKKDPVKELEVGSYQELKSRAQVGDGLEHDHIPSFAALKKAKENELGRKLTDKEAKTLYNEATTIEVSRDTHKAGRTHSGKNTPEQIAKDASNLCEAQRCDIDVLRQNLLERGHSKKAVDDAIIKLTERNKDKGIY
ncbi:ESPR-type extended signal peptide-containing protein [Acinetobacter pittii]|uniref:ESPR-type extended signal peptide-containing protein n=1 Tax=Acinetobacter pittii TaxID=48296 RepID=UPI0013EEDE54|nr:ESPR-type extended signal peptide-containing protein [Acinetobacter pittii]